MRSRAHNRFSEARFGVVIAVSLCLLFSLAASSFGQTEDTTRDLWDTAFSPGRKSAKRVNQRGGARNYRVATRAISPNGVTGDTVVGVTVWRLRPADENVEGERIVVHESERDEEWIAERVTNRTRFAEGDRVRLTIEAARAGHLYVVDREQYADGTLGEPHLIFPTMRTRGGDNRVQSGLLVDIPAQSDRPPYLTLRRTRTDHTAEVLSFIVTKAPLDGLQITDRAQTLSAEQVAAWEKSWGGPPGRLELTGGAGQAWTKTEKEASAISARLLSRDAPVPQTIYYNPAIKSDAPFLVTIRLNYTRR
jgi:hypothetical protein